MQPRWVVIARPATDDAARAVLAIPGVRAARKKGWQGPKPAERRSETIPARMLVPENAMEAVGRVLRELDPAAAMPRILEPPRPAAPSVPGAAQAAAETIARWAEGDAAVALPESLRDGVAGWLTEYQRELALVVPKTQGGVLLLWSAGGGKSLGATVATQAAPLGGINVVVTLAGHKRFWRSEIERVCDRRAAVVDGIGQEGRDAAMAGGSPDYLILSWEILDAHVEWLKTLPVGWLVVDESHRASDRPPKDWWKLKTGRPPAEAGAAGAEEYPELGAEEPPTPAAATEAPPVNPDDAPAKPKRKARTGVWSMAALHLSMHARRVLLLSATPMPTSPQDLWTQLEMLAPASTGTWWPYAKRYCDAHQEDVENVGPVWKTDGVSNKSELKSRIRWHTHVVTKTRSHAALPPLRRTVHYVPAAEMLADRMAKAERARLEGDGTAGSLFEARLMMAARRKRPFVLGLLEPALTAGKKVVVFTGRHVDVDELTEEVGKRFAKVKGLWLRGLHGGNSSGAEREEAVGLRQRDGTWSAGSYMAAPGPACLVSTADTLGTGTNLQDTDDLILAMLPYTPGRVTQYENRVHRLGGLRRPNVHYVVAEGTIEEVIAERLLRRLPACADVNETAELEDLRERLSGDDVDDATFTRGLFAALVDGRYDADRIVAAAMAPVNRELFGGGGR